MREFFQGWRRKVGVATLLLACLLMFVWLRSYRNRDTLQFYAGHQHVYLLVSDRSWLYWQSPQQKLSWTWGLPLVTATTSKLKITTERRTSSKRR